MPAQSEPTRSGSDVVTLSVHVAPMGANIRTTRAIRTIGRNFRNRRRINQPTLSPRQPITQRVSSREQVPGPVYDGTLRERNYSNAMNLFAIVADNMEAVPALFGYLNPI